MLGKERISSDEEDDIWDYRSQSLKSRSSHGNVTSQKAPGSSLLFSKQAKPAKTSGKIRSSFGQHIVKTDDGFLETGKRSQKKMKPTQKKTKVKVEIKTERTPYAKKTVDRSGRCPVCQMPFALLSIIETPNWHVDQCLDVPYSNKNECSAGIECNSEIESHYKKFRHTHLARSRRKNETNDWRDKGDVDSAKTKLSFDSKGNNTKLVVPGSSAECVIVIDSSQDSSFSQRSNDDVLDDSLHSQVDEIDGEKVCHETHGTQVKDVKYLTSFFKGNFEKFRGKKHCDNTVKELVTGRKPGKGNIVDKNQNNLEWNKKKDERQSGEDVSESNFGDKEILFNQDEDSDIPELETYRENADLSAGLTRVETIDLSDGSCGSVDDINDIVDDTRSLSDMINDALKPDDASEDSEVDADEVENNKIINKRSKSVWHRGDISKIQICENEDDYPIIDLFTGRPEKQSAISSLRETPAKSPDSDSSSDWEILKTTLTQPEFGQKDMKKDIPAKTDLGQNSSQLYKEFLKTPVKDSRKVDEGKNETKNKPAKIILSKQKMPDSGFFATKMLQNTLGYNKLAMSHTHSAHLEEKDKESNSDEPSKENSHQEIYVKSPVKTEKRLKNFSNKRSNTNALDESNKLIGIPATAYSPVKSEYLVDKDKNTKTGRLRSAKLKTPMPSKQEFEEPEVVKRKPKIEMKPKTPIKRKLEKNVSQKQKVRKDTSVNTRQETVASFFKVKGLKSESSGDCERFNKIGRFMKCCSKYTEGQGCQSNYTETMNGLSGLSSAEGSPCVPLQTNAFHGGRNTSSVSSTCTGREDIRDHLSCFDSCSTCTSSVASSKATSCRGCELSQCFSCSKFSGRSHGNGCQSQNNQTSNSSSYENAQQGHIGNRSQVGLGQVCSHCHHQTGSQHTNCQVCSQKSQGQHSHIQTCSQSSQNQTGSQHSQTLGSQNKRTCCDSQNNSLNNSTCSLHFNIENVCTLSQNTYTNMGGGFITENCDSTKEPVNNPHCASFINKETSCTSSTPQQSGVSVSDTEVESIVQIRKSATDILMASSRLLYNKSAQNTSNLVSSSKQKQGNDSAKTSVNEVLMRKSFDKNIPSASKTQTVNSSQGHQRWKGTRVSTSTETSEDSNEVKRKCPFYKKIPETCMTVDAFRYGNIPDCRAYILSHFHYDHYMGLSKHFRNPIYCSKITGNLVKKKIGVDSQYIHTLPLYIPTVVENVEITFLEANHCPGAVLILFKLRSGKIYLHTGDFRACQAMELYPQIQNLRIHSLNLDTTYCDPQYDFPPQEEVIQFTVKLALDALANNPKTLIVCGSYSIGKERIFTAIAEELDCKICVTRDKKTVIDCMEDDKLKQRVSLRWEDSCLHVVPMNKIKYQNEFGYCLMHGEWINLIKNHGLQEHLLLNGKKYNSVLGIEPTGWTHSKKNLSLFHIKPKVNKDSIKIYGIPYSEHSSFLELKRFVQFTKPAKILPTVNNGNFHSRRKMEVIFEAWMEEIQSQRTPTNRQSSITGWTK